MTAPNEGPETAATSSSEPEGTTGTDYDKRIEVLRNSLSDVQKPESLKHRTGRNLLAHADLILDILDSIHDLHPFIGVATFPFKATLKIVLVKQDNDKRIAALMIEMIDMMSALIELRHTKEQNRKTDSGETVKDNLTRVLKGIKIDIEEVGNIVDSYSKEHIWRRVLFAEKWSDQFKDFAERFQKGKANIQTALSIHMTLAVDTLQPKVDQVLLLMQEWFSRPPSSDERRLNAAIQEKGKQNVLDDETVFRDLYEKYGSGERPRESAGAASDKRGSNDANEKDKEAKEQWQELKRSLTSVLSENRPIFDAKLEVQKRDLTSVIRQSEATIIRAINDGPHLYIEDPVIRDLWKAMVCSKQSDGRCSVVIPLNYLEQHWRLSVKTRHFVMALHDHYLHDLTYAAASWGFISSTSDHPTDSKDAFSPAALVDPADKWCLQYLRIRHLPAISEAFDDDGSGFIKIGEVNEFTRGIPKDLGWTLLQWVAYWTAGWATESWNYAGRIRQTLVNIAEAQLLVKRENIKDVNEYMSDYAMSEIQLLVSSVQSPDTPADSDLTRLVSTYSSHTEKKIGENLKTVKYNVDHPDSLSVICGTGRVEKYLLPLLHLLLLRHLEIIHFASEAILDPQELTAAQESLDNAMQTVWLRVEELKESFRQQKLDINEHFDHFACGIYSRYHYSDAAKGMGLTPQPADPESSDDDSDFSDTTSQSESSDTASEPSDKAPTLDGPESVSALGSPVDSNDLHTAKPVTSAEDNYEAESLTAGTGLNPHITDPAADSDAQVLQEVEGRPSVSSAKSKMDTLEEPNDPTRFGPWTLNTTLYADPPNLTADSLPWRPLGVNTSVGPREKFRLAAQRVLERIQLLSPRLTWAYLQRRREIRLKWIEISLRSDSIYLGDGEYEQREPPKQHDLDDLKLQITMADESCYISMASLEERRRVRQSAFYDIGCDGCHLQIIGKRFFCLDCLGTSIDLCDACKQAETLTYSVEKHSPSHTMIQYPYPPESYAMFDSRARKYMVKHAKEKMPCCDMGQGSLNAALICNGCKKELRDEIHFRCLQCPDYNLCGACEQAPHNDHCVAHALLKLKAPFQLVERTADDSDSDEEEEQQPRSVEARLVKLGKRMNEMETKFGGRLDELQKGFARVIELLEQTAKQGSGEAGSHTEQKD